MSAPDRRASVDAIREAARLAVEAGSLRGVARAIGMSPMGLKHFLSGTHPYRATQRKLLSWYVVYQSEAGGFSIETVRSSLQVLTDGLPVKARGPTITLVLDTISQQHKEAGTRPPSWLATLMGE